MSFDIIRHSYFDNPTVGNMIEALQKLPLDIPFYFCGSSTGYLHVNLVDHACCNIDYEDLYDDYVTVHELLEKNSIHIVRSERAECFLAFFMSRRWRLSIKFL